MIEVRLFGDLRRYAHGAVPGSPPVLSGVAVHIPAGEARTVGQVLAYLAIDPDEVGKLFLNGRLVPRSLQAVHLGYPLARSAPLSPEASLDVAVEDGDRVGVFARKMCLLVV
jgi:hypothetical protein